VWIFLVILEVTAGGETLATTPGRPFWVLDHGWKDAGDLEVGDCLVNLRGESVVVEDIRRRPVPEAVYNFSVAGLHTYFMGQGGIWVHNNSGSGCGVPGVLSQEAKDALREQARDAWQSVTGRRAMWDKLDVHHRIPLKWAHLLPDADPNRLINLV
jgi:hypothetical protein